MEERELLRKNSKQGERKNKCVKRVNRLSKEKCVEQMTSEGWLWSNELLRSLGMSLQRV